MAGDSGPPARRPRAKFQFSSTTGVEPAWSVSRSGRPLTGLPEGLLFPGLGRATPRDGRGSSPPACRSRPSGPRSSTSSGITERPLSTLGLVARVTVSSFLRGWCGAQRVGISAAGARGRRARVGRAAAITPTGQSKHLCTRMPASCEALANEAGQVLGSDADEVHDAGAAAAHRQPTCRPWRCKRSPRPSEGRSFSSGNGGRVSGLRLWSGRLAKRTTARPLSFAPRVVAMQLDRRGDACASACI
jgi:hypothetical protein